MSELTAPVPYAAESGWRCQVSSLVVIGGDPVAPSAQQTEAGGWRITLPLVIHGQRGAVYDVMPSKNTAGRHENRGRYTKRRNVITNLLVSVMAMSRPLRTHRRVRTTRIGKLSATVEDLCVFFQVRMTLRIYHRTKSILHSDPQNWISGAEALLDALVNSCWAYDDDREHLWLQEPVLGVDRENPRVEVILEPWDGVRTSS